MIHKFLNIKQQYHHEPLLQLEWVHCPEFLVVDPQMN